MSGPIKPQDRLAWHKQLALDHELSHSALRVGIVISIHFNNGTAECFPALPTIARETGVHRTTALKAIETLARRGHLRVKRGRGRGWANTYSMVVREPYPAAIKGSASTTFSTPKRSDSVTVKGSASATPTLKENSKKESGLAIEERSQPDPPSATARIGKNRRAILKADSPQWQAWLRFHQATGDLGRASLMRHMAENSRWGQWEEATEWPPSHVRPRDNGPRKSSDAQPPHHRAGRTPATKRTEHGQHR